MDREETAKIMSLFRAAYPKFYDGKGKKELEGIVSLWHEMFPEPYEVVAAAVKALISTDIKGFPPVIGQVKEKIHLLTHPQEMAPMEAWSYVAKAIRNSAYNSKEEFEKLPEIVQAVVGSPDQLQEWAGMDADTVQSVIASNFQRSFQGRAKQAKEWQMLPPEVKEMQKQLTAGFKGMPELPEKDETKLIAMRDDKVRRTRNAFEVQALFEGAVKDVSKIPNPWAGKQPTEEEKKGFEDRRKSAIAKLGGMK